MRADFTLSAYREMLSNLRGAGYAFSRFGGLDIRKRQVLLRHDVDQSLQAAAIIAEAEHELSISSTYFLLLRTEMYNVLSPDGRDAIAAILYHGHQVGLHFDPTAYDDDPQGLSNGLELECDILERVTGRPVEVVSFHRPASSLIGKQNEIQGRINAYGERYVHDIGYCSDSTGRWRYGHPLEHDAVRAGRPLQLLTHPIWWYRDEPVDLQRRLESFLSDRTKRLDRELAANCKPYRSVNPLEPEAN